jgi:glucosamine-6-phosphate deaminase
MKLVIKKTYDEACGWAADYIAAKVNAGARRLGLPTGSSPVGIYQKLAAHCKAGRVSFKDVVTFNMDEYLGLEVVHPLSYHFFMWDTFFKHIDIRKENVHILDGMAPDPDAECAAYEKAATETPIDLFLGGIGRNGHIAFNEPGSSPQSKTRVIAITEDTVLANARWFGGDISQVPTRALTVGIGTVLSAKEVLIIVNGYGKARALAAAVEGPVSQMCPLSFLQLHADAKIVCDEEACEELKFGTVRYYKSIEG